jgi:hypothetical protein
MAPHKSKSLELLSESGRAKRSKGTQSIAAIQLSSSCSHNYSTSDAPNAAARMSISELLTHIVRSERNKRPELAYEPFARNHWSVETPMQAEMIDISIIVESLFQQLTECLNDPKRLVDRTCIHPTFRIIETLRDLFPRYQKLEQDYEVLLQKHESKYKTMAEENALWRREVKRLEVFISNKHLARGGDGTSEVALARRDSLVNRSLAGIAKMKENHAFCSFLRHCACNDGGEAPIVALKSSTVSSDSITEAIFSCSTVETSSRRGISPPIKAINDRKAAANLPGDLLPDEIEDLTKAVLTDEAPEDIIQLKNLWMQCIRKYGVDIGSVINNTCMNALEGPGTRPPSGEKLTNSEAAQNVSLLHRDINQVWKDRNGQFESDPERKKSTSEGVKLERCRRSRPLSYEPGDDKEIMGIGTLEKSITDTNIKENHFDTLDLHRSWQIKQSTKENNPKYDTLCATVSQEASS